MRYINTYLLLLLYNVADAESCNEARTTLFSRCRSPDALPSRLHSRRAHVQAMIWKQAHLTNPTFPLPETMGYEKLVPKLMSLVPVP